MITRIFWLLSEAKNTTFCPKTFQALAEMLVGTYSQNELDLHFCSIADDVVQDDGSRMDLS